MEIPRDLAGSESFERSVRLHWPLRHKRTIPNVNFSRYEHAVVPSSRGTTENSSSSSR